MVKVRRGRLADVPAVLELWKDFLAEMEPLVLKSNPAFKPYTEKSRDAVKKFKAFLTKKVRSRNGALFIAEEGGEAVGYCLCFIKEETPIFTLKRVGYISDLYVRKAFRGKGLSSKFRRAAFKWFKSKGIKHASITVNCANPRARKIYRKWGFFDYHLEMRRKI